MSTFRETALAEVTELQRRQGELNSRKYDAEAAGKWLRTDPVDLAEIGSRFDPVYEAVGAGGAPAPISGESVHTYRRRLATALQPMSPRWREDNLFDLFGHSLDVAEAEIIEDAYAHVADRTRGNDDGSLREIRTKNAAGGVEVIFAGDPAAWLSAFAPATRKCIRAFKRPDGPAFRVQRRSI